MTEQNDDSNTLVEDGDRKSGTFPRVSTAPVENNISNGNGESAGERDRYQLLQERLSQREVYKARTETRNNLRFWEEKHQWAARIFGGPHIEAMTAEDIQGEQKNFHERILRLLARREKEVHPVQTLAFLESTEKTDHNKTMMVHEEMSKYLGTKARKYIEMKKYAKARSVLQSGRVTIQVYNGDDRLDFVSRFVAIDAIRDCFFKGDKDHIIEAIRELGAVAKLEKTDFEDIAPEILKNTEIQKLFLQWMTSLIKTNPKLYPLVRDYLAQLGFIDAQRIDTSPAVQKTAQLLLLNSMDQDLKVYIKYSDTLHHAGVILQEEANNMPEIQQRARKILIKNMDVSPELYAAVRDDMASVGLVDAKKMNEELEIQKRLIGHLLCWEELNKALKQKFGFWWSKKGLLPSTLEELTITADEARNLVKDGGSSFKGLNPDWYQHTNAHDHVRIFENEKNEVKKAIDGMKLRQERTLGRSQNEDQACSVFLRDYPQFVHNNASDSVK